MTVIEMTDTQFLVLCSILAMNIIALLRLVYVGIRLHESQKRQQALMIKLIEELPNATDEVP